MKKKLLRTMFQDFPDVVDAAQLQQMLGVGRHTIYALLKSGEIHSVIVGNKYRVPKVSVIKYLTRKEKHSSTERKGA